jgi:transposase
MRRNLGSNLLELSGCGALSAAKLIGETAGIIRFKTQARFAMHNGSAPIPVWSGNSQRHRLNRSGNRQLNAALHRIALTQMRLGGRGYDYIQHRRACGDTKKEAIRALRRRISDEVFRRMWLDAKNAISDHARAAA